MANWIYLKIKNCGFDDLNAVALASVLSASSERFNVVHTKMTSKYLKGLENVIVGYPSEKDGEIVTMLNLPEYAPFELLCETILDTLCIKLNNKCSPYLGFASKRNEIDRQLQDRGDLILFCYYIEEREVFLVPRLEEVVKTLNAYSFISCGSKREPLIKGSYDFRELIKIDEIIKNRNRIKAIITANNLVKEIGSKLDIPVIYLFSYSYILYYKKKEIIESSFNNFAKKLTDTITNVCNNKIESTQTIKINNIFRKFEVPYSFDEVIIPYYAHYLPYIHFLYLPPFFEDSINTRTCLQSNIKGYSYMPRTRDEYEYHLRLIKERNLRFVVLWQDRERVISKKQLDYYTQLGASGFIIANDKNAQIIKKYNSSLLVISSIVQRICKGISKRNFKWYDFCVLFYPFTRSLDAVKRLSGIKDKLIIIPNSFCHTDCPGLQHWFAKDIKFFEFDKFCPAFNNATKSTFIYPEHLSLFDDFVGGYKLQGREWPTDYIITSCEAYFHRIPLETLVPLSLNKELKEMHKKASSLEYYYNIKTDEIIDII